MPYLKGERHPRAKLTAQDVLDIRAEYRPRVVTYRHLAERYGVSEGTIRDIVSGRTWASGPWPQGRRRGASPSSPSGSEPSPASLGGTDAPRDSEGEGSTGAGATRNSPTSRGRWKTCLSVGCNRVVGEHGARGMCATHYQQWRRKHGHLRCAAEGCMAHQLTGAEAKGRAYTPRQPGRRGTQTGEAAWFCREHESQLLAPSDEIEQLNLSRLGKDIRADGRSGCWLWTGSMTPDGYGRFQPEGANGDDWYTHRALYDLLVGGHGPGLQLDHRCDQRACVAPFHLRAVTPSANSKRRGKAVADPIERQTACLPTVQQFAQEHGLPLPVLWT